MARRSARALACSTWNRPKRTACCDVRVALDLHVGGVPEVVEVGALRLRAGRPSRLYRAPVSAAADLVAQRRARAQARPPVGQVLDDPQPLAGPQHADDRGAGPVGAASVSLVVAAGRLDVVVHAGRHQQAAGAGAVQQQGAVLPVSCCTASAEARSAAATRGSRGHPRLVLVRHQLGLHGDPQSNSSTASTIVLDGGDAALGERDEPGASGPSPVARPATASRRRVAASGPQVENPLVVEQLAVAHVERLVVDDQPDDLAVGDVDDGLAVLRDSRNPPPA